MGFLPPPLRGALARRWPGAAAVALATAAAALLAAVLWPPLYRAEAVLQADPAETLTGDIRAQLDALGQRMLTRTNLLELSSRLGLHDGQILDAGAILDDMRSRIGIVPHVIDGAAPALHISFDSPNPRVAAHVATTLAEFLLTEAVAEADPATARTAEILRREALRLEERLHASADQIAAFRAASSGPIPAAPQHHGGAAAPAGGPAQAERDALRLERLERQHDALRLRHDATTTRIATFRAIGGNAPDGPRVTLHLLEPAAAPRRPVAPDRNLIAAGGLALGLLLALAYTAIAERSDQTIRNPAQLARHLGQAPFATIPYLAGPGEVVQRRTAHRVRAATAAAAIAAVLGGLHLFWQPFDVLLSDAVAGLGLGPLFAHFAQYMPR